MDRAQKITLIESPGMAEGSELDRFELEEVLGGWNCGSYSITETEKIIWIYKEGFNDQNCSNGGADYCGLFSCSKYDFN